MTHERRDSPIKSAESNADPERPRPVVDAASSQKRRQDIIGAVMGVVFGIPTLVLLFSPDLVTPLQLAGLFSFFGLISAALMVVVGRADYQTALKVEVEVTPGESPQDKDGVPLVPQVFEKKEVITPDYVA